MPVDCSNPTNALGQTASDPCRGLVGCLTEDYNAWVVVVKETGSLLGLARERLRSEVMSPQLKQVDPDRYGQLVILISRMNEFQVNSITLQTKPIWIPDVFDLRDEVYEIRDRALKGCGLLMRAAVELKKENADTTDLWGKLKIWEDMRTQAPIRWGTWAKIGGIVLGVVALFGALGYAATGVARARATSPTTRKARASNPKRM